MAGELIELHSKYGEKLQFERNLKTPLWRKRSCTDIPCLLLFLIFLGAWAFIASYAWHNRDLDKFFVPTDSFNRKCGIDAGVFNKKYLFFFDLYKCIDPLISITGCQTPQICVDQCPQQIFIWNVMKSLPLKVLKTKLICLAETDKENITTIEKAIKEERCAKLYFPSVPLLNRCVYDIIPNISLLNTDNKAAKQSQALALTESSKALPHNQTKESDLSVIKEKMMQTNTKFSKYIFYIVAPFSKGTAHEVQQVVENVLNDISNSYIFILFALLCVLIGSFILIALMRWLASPFLWSLIFCVLIGLLVAIYFSIKQYTFYHRQATVPQQSSNLYAVGKNLLQDESLWLYLSIFLCSFFVILLLLLIVFPKRINIALVIIEEGSKAVSSVKSTLVFPIFTTILFILAIVYAVTVGVFLRSIGENSFRMFRQSDSNSSIVATHENCNCSGPAINYTIGASCVPEIFQEHCYNDDKLKVHCSKAMCRFGGIQYSTSVNLYMFFNVFGYFWLTFFISAFGDMVLACTFATWYWTFKKRDVPFFTLTKAIFQTSFYHLGTLAFGSLILAICRMIRLILDYIDKKIEKYDNALTRAILCLLKCFFWLLETFLRFLSHNAYIMCAIHGKNFCGSAKDAFNLTVRNCLRVFALGKVTYFLFFISKLFITGGAGAATYFFLLYNPINLKLHYKAVPTAIITLGAYLIATLIFSVYSMAVDTLFMCFLEDIERHDGSVERPYYMSKQLLKILGKHNKIRTPYKK